MKRSAELVGMPVVSIEEGVEAGRVSSLVINAASGEISAVAVACADPFAPPKVVPFALIQGLGEDAIVIENMSSIVDMSSIPELAAIAKPESEVRGTRVMTRAGKLVGIVKEIIVDTDEARIAGYELDSTSSPAIVPSGQVITIGRQVLITSADVESHMVAEPDDLCAC